MGQTVVNECCTVVHKASAHTAKSSDPCLNGTWDNCAYSASLAAGKSTKTKILNQPIAMEGTHWDPSTSAGVTGKGSGTTCKEAWVTSGSKDLFIEGTPAARAGDPTKQNQGNSVGVVSDGTIAPRADSEEERAKKKCQLASWKGVAGGSFLGYKGKDKSGQPNYLEVWDTDKITFTSYRKDITQTPPAINQKCEAPTKGGELHTIWDAKGKVFPLYLRTEQRHAHSTDTFTIPANMVTELWSSGSIMKAIKDGDMNSAMTQMTRGALSKFATNDGEERVETMSGVQGLGRQDYGGDINPDDADVKHGKTTVVRRKSNPVFEGDIGQILFYAWWWVKPPEIKVSALACAGARQATIKVLPNQMIRFKLNLERAAKNAVRRGKASKYKYDKKKEATDAAEKRMSDAKKQADQVKKNWDQQLQAQQNALNKLQSASAKNSSIGGNTGANEKGRARQQRKMDKAHEQWKKAGDEAKKSWDTYRVAMAKYESQAAHFNKAVGALKTVKKAMTIAQKIATIAKQPLRFSFLEGCSLTVELAYERTEERMSARRWRYYTTATMGQRWKFELALSPILQFQYTAYFSLLNFVTFYVPGLAQMLRRFRIFRVDVFFSIKLSLGANVQFTKGVHDELSGGAEARANVTPAIGAVMGGAGVDIVRFTASLPMQIKALLATPTTKGPLATLTPRARIGNYYRGVIFPDRWWEIEALAGSIKGLKYYYNTSGRVKYNLGSLPA